MLNLNAIRNAIYGIITSTDAFTTANTDLTRYEGDSIASSDLPRAVIQFESSEFEYESIGSPRSIRITSNFTVNVFAKTEVAIDALTEQILNAFDDRTLGDNVQDLMISNVEYQFSSEADNDYGRATISLTTQHSTTIND